MTFLIEPGVAASPAVLVTVRVGTMKAKFKKILLPASALLGDRWVGWPIPIEAGDERAVGDGLGLRNEVEHEFVVAPVVGRQ